MLKWEVVGILFVLCGLGAQPVHSQEGACYDVVVGEWSPVDSTHVGDLPRPGRPDQTADSVIYSHPVRVRLDSVQAQPAAPGNFLLSVPENVLQVPHPWRSWHMEGDSLRLVLSTGFSGTVSRLVREGDGWDGTAGTFVDVAGTLSYQRPVRLDAVDCGSAPPIPASVDPPLLRSVALISGGTLALGEPLPPGTATQPRRSGALTVLDGAAAPWFGTDTIVVVLAEDGVVGRIELRYPAEFDLGPSLGALEADFGPGNQVLGDEGSRFWRNRTTRIWLMLDRRRRMALQDPRWRF